MGLNIQIIMTEELTALLVDDENYIIELLQRILNRNGITNVDAVATTREGLDLLRKKNYGLVLTDLNQNPSGLDVYRTATAKGSKAYIMTGYAPDMMEAQGVAKYHFLQKPFDIKTIDKIIKNYIAQERYQS